jgi:hypothetical protein
MNITTSVQLSLEIQCINKQCYVKKSINCIIIASELKMGLLYSNLYT